MSSPLETRFLLAAVILAEELSFTGAAKRLKMSQSGVSRRLNELEERCGFKFSTGIMPVLLSPTRGEHS
jgi:hypothetical protein